MNFLKQMFVDKDGVADMERVAAFFMVLAFVWNAVHALYLPTPQVWNPQDYGIGAGALAAGLGALLRLRGEN